MFFFLLFLRFVKKETRRRKRRIGLEDAHQRPASGASGCLFHWEIVNKKEKQKKTGSHLMCRHNQQTKGMQTQTHADTQRGEKDERIQESPTGLKNI